VFTSYSWRNARTLTRVFNLLLLGGEGRTAQNRDHTSSARPHPIQKHNPSDDTHQITYVLLCLSLPHNAPVKKDALVCVVVMMMATGWIVAMLMYDSVGNLNVFKRVERMHMRSDLFGVGRKKIWWCAKRHSTLTRPPRCVLTVDNIRLSEFTKLTLLQKGKLLKRMMLLAKCLVVG
jgi:hypothetical protein